MAERPGSPPAPELLVESNGDSQVIDPHRIYHVGRDPTSDVVLSDARVSWHHAVLRATSGHWLVEDEGSTNGTYADGRRVEQSGVGPGSVIRFGNPADGPCAVLTGVPRLEKSARRPSAVSTRPAPTPSGSRVRYGRSPRPGPYGSAARRTTTWSSTTSGLAPARRAARRPAERYEIVDLGSRNGTYRQRPAGDRAPPITPGDIVGIGPSDLRTSSATYSRSTSTPARSPRASTTSPSRSTRARSLLDHVSLPARREVACSRWSARAAPGKSTLLSALTGLRPADEGTVLYDGRDLYRDYAELRQRIGLVPQDDILHSQLTVRRALGYAAAAALPRRHRDSGAEGAGRRGARVSSAWTTRVNSRSTASPAASASGSAWRWNC